MGDPRQLELPFVERTPFEQRLAAEYADRVALGDVCETCDGTGSLEIDQFSPRRGHWTKTFPCPNCSEPHARLRR